MVIVIIIFLFFSEFRMPSSHPLLLHAVYISSAIPAHGRSCHTEYKKKYDAAFMSVYTCIIRYIYYIYVCTVKPPCRPAEERTEYARRRIIHVQCIYLLTHVRSNSAWRMIPYIIIRVRVVSFLVVFCTLTHGTARVGGPRQLSAAI